VIRLLLRPRRHPSWIVVLEDRPAAEGWVCHGPAGFRIEPLPCGEWTWEIFFAKSGLDWTHSTREGPLVRGRAGSHGAALSVAHEEIARLEGLYRGVASGPASGAEGPSDRALWTHVNQPVTKAGPGKKCV